MNKFKSNRDRDSNRPSMHKAICDECGNNCEVPFKPIGNKPIYCSECFRNKGGGNSRNPDRGRGNNRYNRRDSRRRDSRRPSMHRAVCTECGNDCEIPFKPRSDKPVYCSKCFENKGSRNKRGNNNDQYKEQLNMINSKLDKILNILDPTSKKNTSSEKENITKVSIKKKKESKQVKDAAKEKKESKSKKVTKKVAKKKNAVKKPAKKKKATKKTTTTNKKKK